ATADGDELRRDREPELRRLVAAEVESDRGMEAADPLLGNARPEQVLAALLLPVATPDRADVGRLAGQRGGERGLVDLRIVRDDDDVVARAQLGRRHHLVRPADTELDPREAGGIGESGARVDDDRMEAGLGDEPG